MKTIQHGDIWFNPEKEEARYWDANKSAWLTFEAFVKANPEINPDWVKIQETGIHFVSIQ